MFPEVYKNHSFVGNKHNGIDDCINQIQIVQKCYDYIKKNTSNEIFVSDIDSCSFESKIKGCICFKKQIRKFEIGDTVKLVDSPLKNMNKEWVVERVSRINNNILITVSLKI